MYPENLAIKVLSIHGRIEVTKVTARAYDILFTSFLFPGRGTWKEGFWNTTICKVQSLNLRRNSENPIYTIFWSYENKNA